MAEDEHEEEEEQVTPMMMWMITGGRDLSRDRPFRTSS